MTSDTSRAPAFPPGAIVRRLTELPPIEDTAMQSTYPAAQARVHTAHLCRTPIDPPTAIKGLVMTGNTDLQPATWNPPAWVKPIIGTSCECPDCLGHGVLPGDLLCQLCMGTGRVHG